MGPKQLCRSWSDTWTRQLSTPSRTTAPSAVSTRRCSILSSGSDAKLATDLIKPAFGARLQQHVSSILHQDLMDKVFQKQSSVQEMFEKRRVSLKKLAAKQTRPVQPVAPRPEVKSPLSSPSKTQSICIRVQNTHITILRCGRLKVIDLTPDPERKERRHSADSALYKKVKPRFVFVFVYAHQKGIMYHHCTTVSSPYVLP